MEKLYKVELAFAVVLIFVVALAFYKPTGIIGITGFVSSETHRQEISLVAAQSQKFALSGPQNAALGSVAASGTVSGDGAAYVYLNNDRGQKLLVYTNVKTKKQNINAITGTSNRITGYAIKDIPNGSLEISEGTSTGTFIPLEAGESATAGAFKDACVETCIVPEDLFKVDKASLEVLVQPGTTMTLTHLTYVLVTP